MCINSTDASDCGDLLLAKIDKDPGLHKSIFVSSNQNPPGLNLSRGRVLYLVYLHAGETKQEESAPVNGHCVS